MTRSSLAILALGSFLFILALINAITIDSFSPSTLRAEAIACISSIVIIGISTIWIRIEPNKSEKVNLNGDQGIIIDNCLPQSIKDELAWGSHQILTATAAATVLIHLGNETILKRGLITNNNFSPGRICKRAISNQKIIILSNTNNYPDSYEFDSIVPNLPSVLICPMGSNGILIVGGWSKRCFTKSDEIWIEGWSKKLSDLI